MPVVAFARDPSPRMRVNSSRQAMSDASGRRNSPAAPFSQTRDLSKFASGRTIGAGHSLGLAKPNTSGGHRNARKPS